MEEKSLPDVIAQLAQAVTSEPAPTRKPLTKKSSLQADTLRVLAGLSGGEADSEISEFLNGRGSLLETTRLALTHGKKTAVTELADFLTRQFKMSPAAAGVVAALLIKLFPSIGKLTGAAPAPRKRLNEKPNRRARLRRHPKSARRRPLPGKNPLRKRKRPPKRQRNKTKSRAGILCPARLYSLG